MKFKKNQEQERKIREENRLRRRDQGHLKPQKSCEGINIRKRLPGFNSTPDLLAGGQPYSGLIPRLPRQVPGLLGDLRPELMHPALQRPTDFQDGGSGRKLLPGFKSRRPGASQGVQKSIRPGLRRLSSAHPAGSQHGAQNTPRTHDSPGLHTPYSQSSQSEVEPSAIPATVSNNNSIRQPTADATQTLQRPRASRISDQSRQPGCTPRNRSRTADARSETVIAVAQLEALSPQHSVRRESQMSTRQTPKPSAIPGSEASNASMARVPTERAELLDIERTFVYGMVPPTGYQGSDRSRRNSFRR